MSSSSSSANVAASGANQHTAASCGAGAARTMVHEGGADLSLSLMTFEMSDSHWYITDRKKNTDSSTVKATSILSYIQ